MFTAELHREGSDLPSTCETPLQKELYERLKNTTHLVSIFLLEFIGVADNVLAGTKFELEDQVSEQIRDCKAASWGMCSYSAFRRASRGTQ